jgi:CRISPR-associated protein Cas1
MGAWKSVRITKPCNLRIKNRNLIIKDDEISAKISLEDTDSIVFEGDRFTLSAKVLSSFSKYKIAVLFCDEYYMPSTILHPYHQSSLATENIKIQLTLNSDFKDELWKEIIKNKIVLQAEVLDYFDKDSSKVYHYLSHLRSADKHNAEAKSARVYWSELFYKLKREQESMDIRNQALNYAYAIMRSLITRDISVAGFLPALGLWHDNLYNAFNLSDDLMEPFRPLIDLGVKKILENFEEDFITPELKKELVLLFDREYILHNEGFSTIRNSSKLYVASFKRSIKKEDISLMEFPSFQKELVDECF